ncbi:STM4015 family protein [Nonomuraea sp. NPDC000554]|uniref:STM4015 family protein n=1 Tax=Nonomuraea sp. NPDC000554 TaxID=3154259 RepID=UPI003321F097
MTYAPDDWNEEIPADPRDPGEVFIPESGAYRHDMAGAHRERFAGLPIMRAADWQAGAVAAGPAEVAHPYPWQVAWELVVGETDGSLENLLDTVEGHHVRAIVFPDGGARDAPEILAANAHRLPRLRSVFLGMIEPEYFEISWIQQGDLTPLLEAYPRLERLDVRGSDGLELSPVRHEHLKVLRFESGGLPGKVVRAVGESAFPGLEHLELWLGVAHYGGDATVADLRGILSGERLPALRRLGLRDSEFQDDVAAAVAAAPVVARLESLSLAMGELTDTGAEALLSGQPFTHLRHLDLHHHFVSDEMADRLRRALPGVTVDLSEKQPFAEGATYVAVSE